MEDVMTPFDFATRLLLGIGIALIFTFGYMAGHKNLRLCYGSSPEASKDAAAASIAPDNSVKLERE
jgi:hypothetical protein